MASSRREPSPGPSAPYPPQTAYRGPEIIEDEDDEEEGDEEEGDEEEGDEEEEDCEFSAIARGLTTDS